MEEHDKKNKNYLHHELFEEDKSLKGKLMESLREVVFGLEDGVVSTMGAITGIAASTGSMYITVLSGFVIIFVESLSMAAGTFLSSKSEQEVEERMLREEAEEIELHPEAEKQELRFFYKERGFTEDEIEILVNRVTQDKKLWLEEMAFKELGVIPNKERTPYRDAFIMGASYVVGGILPLSAYFYLDMSVAIPVSVISSIVFLFIMGVVKGRLVHTNKLKSGLEMMIVSASAAGLGFAVGRIVAHFFGVEV